MPLQYFALPTVDFPINWVVLELQVAIFVVLAMVLRRKPDVLISLLPIMRENPKYQGQDKLPVTAWIIAQVTVENIEDMISCPVLSIWIWNWELYLFIYFV